MSALLNLFGTIQTAVVAALIVTDFPSWKINFHSFELLAILYGVTYVCN